MARIGERRSASVGDAAAALDTAPDDAADATLWHVLLVGGTRAQWQALDDDGWSRLMAGLGAVADGVGARWLVLRPLDDAASAGAGAAPAVRRQAVGGCTVTADAEVDGRARFVAAVESLRRDGVAIAEEAVDRVLDAPAEANPDLAVVLGPAECWPRPLMWELAYSELVYLDVPWDALQPAHLADAITAYAQRHRRFGGVD
ncbi:MAG: undecaprenyl diphosphate synthase family protein [Ilumatobacteraceae bacterium]